MTTAPESTLREFGESASLPGLSFSDQGHVSLQLEFGRRIRIEHSENEVLVGMAQPAPYDAADRLLRAWKRAHYTHYNGHAVQAALQESNDGSYLLALVRVPANDFTVQRLQRSIEFLSSWLDIINQDH